MFPKASRLQEKALCFSWHNCKWEDMGRAWPRSQSHSGKLDSGEPPCLPLLSQRALFVTCYHRLSRHRVLWPHTLLSCIFPFWPPRHHPLLPLLHTQHLKGEMSSFSPHMALKGPSAPVGPLVFLWQSICSTLTFGHLPIYPSSALSICLLCLSFVFSLTFPYQYLVYFSVCLGNK